MPLDPPMETSSEGIAAIKKREGFRSTAYPDATGYSIGYGHFGVPKSMIVTEEEATDMLLADARRAEDAINSLVEVPLTQNQFDALVSFIYNVGTGAFQSSTLLKRLNEGCYGMAAAQFPRWIFSQGHESIALEARRNEERDQFEGTREAMA